MNVSQPYCSKRKPIFQALLSLYFPCITLAFSHLSAAQTMSAETKKASKNDSSLEEVVVTAQKREQNLQAVGIAINSYSGGALEDLGVYNSNQLAEKVANLTIVSPSGEGGVVATFIRGVGLNNFALNTSGPVGYYVDGSIVGSTNAQMTTLFDIERVEVLKGPQGTLFGRNTTGGAINIISNKPADTFENRFILGVDRFANYRTEGVISGRLSETINGRLAIVNATQGGYLENLSNGDTVERRNMAGRVMLDISTSDDTQLLLNLHGSGLHGDSDLPGQSTSTDSFYQNAHGDRPYTIDTESAGASALFEWNLSKQVQLVSVTSYDHFDKRQDQDLDALPQEFIEVEYNAELDTFAQEFRLQGSHNAINWVSGLYFLQEDNDWLMNINLIDLPIDPVNAPGLTFGTPILNGDQQLNTAAAFGQLEYQWADAWQWVFGLRYTELTVDFNFDAEAPNLAVITPTTGILSTLDYDNDLINQAVSGKVAINFTPNDSSLYYASITRGFKGGGFNGGLVNDFNNYAPRAQYDPETLTAYEVGTKYLLLDQSLRLNMAAFYYDYKDAQVFNSTPDPIFGIAQNVVENADSLEIYGADIDLTWQATPSFLLQAGLGYTHSEFTKYFFSVPTRISAPLSVDIAGETPRNTPEWNLNLLARYSWSLGDSGQITAQADGAYQSKVLFSNGQIQVPGDVSSYDRNESLGQSDYTLWNARVSWANANNQWEIGLWGRNIADEEYRSSMVALQQFFGFDQVIRGVPRNIGLDLRYHF